MNRKYSAMESIVKAGPANVLPPPGGKDSWPLTALPIGLGAGPTAGCRRHAISAGVQAGNSLTKEGDKAYPKSMKVIAEHEGSCLSRRDFLIRSALTGTACLALPLRAAEPTRTPLRAVIIGHTSRGDYGHELDLIFNDLPGVQVMAVADPDPRGREAAATRCKALRQYANYREMLAKEKARLVCVAPRWTDEHHAMATSSLKVGAHLFIEKPFTQTLAEADELLALAQESGLKIAVAHQMRLAPSIAYLKRSLGEGLIGSLLQVRAWGKQDERAGGEDMMVLGTHLFDMLRHLVGDPGWCTARVLHDGRLLTLTDARTVRERIGLVGGNEIEAQFSFPNGVMASFTTRARLRETAGHWGMELIGSKGVVRILMDVSPKVYLLEAGPWEAAGKVDRWTRLKGDPGLNLTVEEEGFGPANRRVVDDWLEAINTNREPACSGRAAMKAVEMVMAIYHASLTGARVPLPLIDRRHPLAGSA
jgi:predicted dehydrogenase